MTNLTIEQQFRLKVLKEDIDKLSLPEAKKYLYELFRQMMVKDNLYKDIVKGL